METWAIAIKRANYFESLSTTKNSEKKKSNKQTRVTTDKTVTIFKWNYLQRLKQKSCLFETRILLKNANPRSRIDFKQNKRSRTQKISSVSSSRALIQKYDDCYSSVW